MTRFYELREDTTSRHSGYTRAVSRWCLPGAHCPKCNGTWASVGNAYPCVDLSGLLQRSEFEEARREPIEEFERLRELVRPLMPPGALVLPGTTLGPLVGTATGSFGAFFYDMPFRLLARREVLEKLQALGMQGLQGCRTQLRFRQRNAPELWELQLTSRGQLHPDCLPPDRAPPCKRCESDSYTLPEQLILDAATMPRNLDLFRLRDVSGLVIASERFVEATHQLLLDGVTFKQLPLR
jgi:uncharacterized double-CXXCG motif protein